MSWLAGWEGRVGAQAHHGWRRDWTDSPVPAEDKRVIPLSMDFVDPQHGWIIGQPFITGGVSAVLLATADGGQTWTAVGGGAFDGTYLTAVDFVDAQHGWVAGDGVFATSDGGATWTKVVSGLGWVAGLAAVDETHVWAGADGGGIRLHRGRRRRHGSTDDAQRGRSRLGARTDARSR